MHDDELMDGLLRDAMAADPPGLSGAFDAQVMDRIRPPRLTALGRLVMAIYIVVAAVTGFWLLRELPMAVIAGAILICGAIAVAARAYGRHLVFEE